MVSEHQVQENRRIKRALQPTRDRSNESCTWSRHARGGRGRGAENTARFVTRTLLTMYGDREYWETRYLEGVIGHCQHKGVLSNEWYKVV